MQKLQPHSSGCFHWARGRRAIVLVFVFLVFAFLLLVIFSSSVLTSTAYNSNRAIPVYDTHYRQSLSTTTSMTNMTNVTTCEQTVLRAFTSSSDTSSSPMGDLVRLTDLPLFDSVFVVIGGRMDVAELYKDGVFLCGMALLYSDLCSEDEESILRCTRRVGTAALDQVLPSICQRTPYYEALNSALTKMEAQCETLPPPTSLPLGIVDETQLLSLPDELAALALAPGSTLMQRAYNSEGLTQEEEDAVRRAYYVPVSQRTVADMPLPLNCSNYSVYTISFAMTERPAHISYRERRLFTFFPVIPKHFRSCEYRPGDVNTNYTLTEMGLHEWLYATLMRYSFFGYSHMRGGWACLRNQEMVYYGVVPVLVDLLLAGPLFLSNMPRRLMHDALLQEPLLQKVGYLKDIETIAHGNSSKENSTDGKYFRRCGRRNVNFVRPGEVDLEPYREEHNAYYAQKGVAPPPPLTHLSPAVVPHFSRWARPLWDSYPRHSAAAMVQYLLNTVGCPDPKRVLVIGCSMFPTDYTHESIVTGFNDLGIFVDTFVYAEADKFRRLSFYNHRRQAEGKNWTAAERIELDKLQAAGYIGDPRTIGMRAWEKERDVRLRDSYGVFSTMGRWNPLLVRRIDGSASRPTAKQHDFRQLKENRNMLNARLLPLLKENNNTRYDLIIYSVVPLYYFSKDRDVLPFLDYITTHIPKQQIVFVDHADYVMDAYHMNFQKAFSKYGWLFQRELVAKCAFTQ